MNGLVLLSIVMVALFGGICFLIYSGQLAATRLSKRKQDQLNRIEQRFQEFYEIQKSLHKRIDQLSTDVLQREIYQNANDRHQLAIKDAKSGRGLSELMHRHGLSSDEAALIVSLHSNGSHDSSDLPENANFDKSVLENIG